MSFRILVINDTPAINHAIEHCIRTEFSGITGDYATSASAGVRKISSEKYDLLLCAVEMDGAAIDHFRNACLSSAWNRDTPFVALAALEEDTVSANLGPLGIRFILSIPFDPHQFSVLMSQLFAKRDRRVCRRYHIPGAEALIFIEDWQLIADIIDISKTGLLCYFSRQGPGFNIFGSCTLSLRLPCLDDRSHLNNIGAHLIRLTAKGWDHEGRPRLIDAAWGFSALTAAHEQVMEKAFELSVRG